MSRLSESLAILVGDYGHLSRRSGISRERLLALAEGAEPTLDEVRSISGALKLSIPALLEASKRTGLADLRFRGGKKNVLPAAEARIFSVVEALRRYKSLIPPRRTLRIDLNPQNQFSIEEASIDVRSFILDDGFVLDPIPDLVSSLDSKRIAHVIKLKNLSVHGASIIVDGIPLVFVASQFPPRSLFTVAHELGHIAFGHLENGRMIIDADNVGSFSDGAMDERNCDAFASALLIPAEGLVRYWRVLRRQFSFEADAVSAIEILFVSHYFCTSFLVAALRFEQLGLLPRGGAFAIEREISDDYGSAEKYSALAGVVVPARQEIKIPIISASLRQSLRRAVSEGEISLGYLADAFGLTTSEMQNALT